MEREKHEKRSNIIITNVKFNNEKITKEVKEFLKQNLQVETQVKHAYKINSSGRAEVVVVNAENWQTKKKVMTNKYHLKGTDTYIDKDMAKNECQIQRNLRQIATKELKKRKHSQSQEPKNNNQW